MDNAICLDLGVDVHVDMGVDVGIDLGLDGGVDVTDDSSMDVGVGWLMIGWSFTSLQHLR